MPEHESGSGRAAAHPKPGTVSNCTHAIDAPINTSAAPILQAPSAADRARLRLLARRLHRLGEAPLFHFLTDLERGADLRGSLETYASLPADFVKAYRGDCFPELFAINGEARR